MNSAGEMADAQVEALKVWEFDENNAWAAIFLALFYASQKRWTDALQVAEKGFPLIPHLIGAIAGILKRRGDRNRSQELLQKLMPGSDYGAPSGLDNYSFVCAEFEEFAHWQEKIIEQRHPLAFGLLPLIPPSPRRSALARLRHLPEVAG
jgi:hypothetical protein